MQKPNISFFEYYPQYKIIKNESYGVGNFDWRKYNSSMSTQSQMISHAMTSSTIKSGYYRRGYNLHGLKAKEMKKFMTEWVGVDRLRGGSYIKRMKNKDEINLQPHRRNKITKRVRLNELMNTILYVDEKLNPGSIHNGSRFPKNWLEMSIRRFYYSSQSDIKDMWGKDKRFSIRFHDITSNVHDEILKFLDMITTPVNYHRIFLLPCVFEGVKGIKSMNANKGEGYIHLLGGNGEGMLLIIPEGFCIPYCSIKDIITEQRAGWQRNNFTPTYYKFKYHKGYGTPTFKSQYINIGGNRFVDFINYINKLFSQYSLYPGDEEAYPYENRLKNRYKKNDLLNPATAAAWNTPSKIKHIINVDFMSEKFIKSLSHKPFKEFIPQDYDNFYTEIKISNTFNTINYLKGVPLEGKNF